jgi:uncharacterized repeat protein (TIGR01451 family)
MPDDRAQAQPRGYSIKSKGIGSIGVSVACFRSPAANMTDLKRNRAAWHLKLAEPQRLLLLLTAVAAFVYSPIALAQQGPGSWMATGIYTGNGQASHAITGIGFAPDLLIIKGGLAEATMVRTATMPDGYAKPLGHNHPLASGTIRTLDADGFTLNADPRVNQPVTLYYWVAFRAVPGLMEVGSYIGDGTDNRNITGLGFNPSYLIVMAADGEHAMQRFGSQTGDQSLEFTNSDLKPDRIQSFLPDGFQIGKHNTVNENGKNFHYVAWKGMSDAVASGSYQGNGSNQDVTTGFGPAWAIIKRIGGSAGVHRHESVSGNVTFWVDDGSSFSNGILMFQPGGFRVGSADPVNRLSEDYSWAAFRDLEGTGADLALAKTVNNSLPNEGDRLTFAIDLTNAGPDSASGVRVIDPIPGGLTFISNLPSQGSYAVGTGIWTVGVLAPNAHARLELEATVDSLTGGATITNRAGVSAVLQEDPVPGNEVDSVAVRVQSADLGVTKNVDDPDPREGDIVTFAIILTNAGPDRATSVVLTDSLSAELTYQSSTPSQGIYSAATGRWNVGTIAAGATPTLVLVARIGSGTAGRTIVNRAAISHADQADHNPSNDAGQATVTIVAADLSVVKTVDRPNASEGDTVRFTVMIHNLGPHQATSVSATDSLPSGLTYVSSSVTQGSYSSASGLWTVGAVDNGGTANLTLVATVDQGTSGTSLVNTALVNPGIEPDPVLGNNTDSASIAVEGADLELVKRTDQAHVAEGDSVAFTVTLRNLGPRIVTGAEVTDTLPIGLTFVSASTSQGTYASGTGLWQAASIAYGDSATLRLLARAEGGTGGTVLTNTAAITGHDQPDPVPENDNAEASVTVAGADLAVVLEVDTPFPNEGDTLSYHVSVHNLGDDDVNGVEAVDALPLGLTYLSSKPSQGSYASGTGVWSVGSVANRDTATLELLARVNTGTSGSAIVNTAAITATNLPDPRSDNNSDTLAVRVQSADLSVMKTALASRVNAGDPAHFQITVRNAGPDAASHVALMDILPAGLRLETAIPSRGSYDVGTGLWNIGTVAPGDSTMLALIGEVQGGMGGTTLLNVADLTAADQADPTAGDRADTAGIYVPVADLALRMNAGAVGPAVGDTLSFTVTLQNDGPDTATGVQVTHALPSSLILLSASPSGPKNGTYLEGVWTLGALAPGDSATLIVATQVVGGGGETVVHSAEISASDEEDPDPFTNSALATVTIQSTLAVSAPPQTAGILHPGATRVEVLSLRVTSASAAPETLTTLRIANHTLGPGTPAQRDLSWSPLSLYIVEGGEIPNTPQATAAMSGGGATFGGIAAVVLPGEALDLLIEAGASLTARDSDRLDLALENRGDLVFTRDVGLSASFPLAPSGAFTVDGMTAAQITLDPLVNSILTAGSTRIPLLEFVVPANGYEPDVLERLNVINAGSADDMTELTRIEAWTDNGDGEFEQTVDRWIGELAFTGGRWEITGLGEAVPAAGLRIFLTCDVSEIAGAGATIRLVLPAAPDDAIGMSSGNDGPLDDEVSDMAIHTVAIMDRVVMAALPVLPSTAAPGDRDLILLHLVATNTYAQSKRITSLTLTNLTAGSGSVAHRDGEIARVSLREDEDRDGALDEEAVDGTLGTGSFSGGRATFTGLDWVLAKNETRHLFITANLSLTGATDGDVVAGGVNAVSDVSFTDATAVAAAWPLDSGARFTVDGMVASQLIRVDAPVATLGRGEGPVLALDIRIPRNGYLDDDLRGLRLRNLGTAGAEDLSGIQLWQDGGNGAFDAGAGDDLNLGALTFDGLEWVSPLLSVPLDEAGARLFTAVRASVSPTDSATVRLELPAGGLIVDSNHDGPIDHGVANANSLILTTSTLLSTLEVNPPTSTLGQTVTARMVVRNVGPDSVTAINPSVLLAQGTGSLQPASGPNPATLNLAPAREDTIVWTFTAHFPGEVLLRGSASGFAGGLPRQSLATESNAHRIFREAQDLELFAIESMPFSINRGQQGVVPLSLTFAHPGGPDDADIEIRSLRFRVENESGIGIVPADLLSRITVSEGADIFLDKTALETVGAVVDLPLTQPARIEPGGVSGGQMTLSLILAISDSTSVPNFRVSIPDSTWFSARDAVSGGPAVVLLQDGTYPVASGLARIGAEATLLEVAAIPDSNRSVGRGQEAVPLLRTTLLNVDPPGFATDVRVVHLRFGLWNAAGAKVGSPEHLLSRVRVRGPFQTHFDGAPVAQSDSLFTLELSPLFSAPANTPLELTIEADVAENANLGSFRARLGDTSSLDARDANTGAPVNVVYLSDPVEGGPITVHASAETLSVRRVAGIPPSITLGQTGVSALIARLAHPGASQVGSIRVDSLTIECRDQVDQTLIPAEVVDQMRVLWDGMEAGVVVNPEGGAIVVPLANARLAPGDSLLLEVRFDVEPTAPATFIELMVTRDGLHAVDDNLGEAVAVVPARDGELPLRSGLSRLVPPARELQIAFANAMPPVLVADGSTLTVARMTLTNTAPPASGPIWLDHLTIRAANRDLGALAVGAALTALQGFIADTLWAESGILAPADSVARLQGADTLLVEPGQPVVIELRATLRPASGVASLRLGCDAAGIGVMQPGSALLAVRVEPTPGQAFPFWSEAGNFSGLSLTESYSNFPNPFAAGRQATRFAFYLDRDAHVTLRLWDARGERVRSLLNETPLAAGVHQEMAWDGLNGAGDIVFHGVYLAELIVRFADGESKRLLRKVAVVR